MLVNVHGGGFSLCDKRDFHLYPTLYALERGYAVVAVNYRLSPRVRYPEHIRDILSALGWIGREGHAYHLDKDNVFLWGTSAGGNIVLQAACAKGLLPRQDDCTLRAVAALCPATDFLLEGGTSNFLERALRGYLRRTMHKNALGGVKPSAQLLKQGDVRNYLAGGIAPLYLQHGTKDPAVPYAVAQEFADRVRGLLPEGGFVFDSIQGAGHAGGGPDFFLREHVDPILDFFDRHLNGKGS